MEVGLNHGSQVVHDRQRLLGLQIGVEEVGFLTKVVVPKIQYLKSVQLGAEGFGNLESLPVVLLLPVTITRAACLFGLIELCVCDCIDFAYSNDSNDSSHPCARHPCDCFTGPLIDS